MKDNYSDHLLMFDANDCNDKDWDIIINCLKDHLPDFQVFYARGDYMNFRWNDQKGGK